MHKEPVSADKESHEMRELSHSDLEEVRQDIEQGWGHLFTQSGLL